METARDTERRIGSAPSALLLCAALSVVVPLLLYSPSLGFGFLYDDGPLLFAGDGAGSIAEAFDRALGPYYPGLPYFRPVSKLTLEVQRLVSGHDSSAFHLFNLALTAILGGMVYAMTRALVPEAPPTGALFASFLFSLHPAVSSVSYAISGRESLLAVIFIALMFWCEPKRGIAWRASQAAAAACAIGSRESALMAPVLLTVYRAARGARGAALFRDAPVYGAAVLMWIARAVVLRGSEPQIVESNAMLPLLSFAYLAQTVMMPFLRLVYEPDAEAWLSFGRLGLAALGFAALLAASRDRPRARVFLALAFLAAIPTSNIVRQETPFDERHVVAPLLFLACATATCFTRGYAGRVSIVPQCVACAICAALAYVGAHRSAAFRSDESFAEAWLASSPRNIQAHLLAASGAEIAGDLGRASELVTRSLALRESDNGHAQLGLLLLRTNDESRAGAECDAALAISPEHVDARSCRAWLAGDALDASGVESREDLARDTLLNRSLRLVRQFRGAPASAVLPLLETVSRTKVSSFPAAIRLDAIRAEDVLRRAGYERESALH